MSNNTSTDPPFYDLGLGLPLWVIIVWSAVGFLLAAMVIILLYVCRTRKRVPTDESSIEEDEMIRQRSMTLIEAYPQGVIEELHTVKKNDKTVYPPSLENNMKIPRATEVKIVTSDHSIIGRNDSHLSALDNSGLSLDELTISISNYDFPDEHLSDFGDQHHKKITLSREASFKTSNLSEENKARQMLRERMLVNELRQKMRRERQPINGEENKWQ